ncbi:MAG: hypothetical protein PHC61_15145 [Chitinivibrionales bacterium]|nr:hypothetical protein [Chitinivibrionales bacterium]
MAPHRNVSTVVSLYAFFVVSLVNAAPPFEPTSLWNIPIGRGAVYSGPNDITTKQLKSASFYGINSTHCGVPIFYAKTSDPTYTIEGYSLSSSVQRFTNVNVPAEALLNSDPSCGDWHINIIDPTGSYVTELYITQTAAAGGGQGWLTGNIWKGQYAMQNPLKGFGPSKLSGAAPILGGGWYATPPSPYWQPTGTRGAGCADIAGAMRTAEFTAGSFPHVLAVALDGTQLATGDGYVWPANRRDFPDIQYTGTIPNGALIAIIPSINLTTLNLTPTGLAMARALQTYGAYVVDFAGNFYIYTETSAGTVESGKVSDASNDLKKLVPYLALITNNTPSTPAGNILPDAVTLVSPTDAAISTVDSVTFFWHKGDVSIIKYWIEVATDSNFANVFARDTTLSDTSRNIKGFNKQSCWWHVKAYNVIGWGPFSPKRKFTVNTPATGVLPSGADIKSFSCNTTANAITYTLSKPCFVSITYYDLSGRTVCSLVNNYRAAGNYSLKLPEASLPRSVYIREFKAGDFVKKDLAAVVKYRTQFPAKAFRLF